MVAPPLPAAALAPARHSPHFRCRPGAGSAVPYPLRRPTWRPLRPSPRQRHRRRPAAGWWPATAACPAAAPTVGRPSRRRAAPGGAVPGLRTHPPCRPPCRRAMRPRSWLRLVFPSPRARIRCRLRGGGWRGESPGGRRVRFARRSAWAAFPARPMPLLPLSRARTPPCLAHAPPLDRTPPCRGCRRRAGRRGLGRRWLLDGGDLGGGGGRRGVLRWFGELGSRVDGEEMGSEDEAFSLATSALLLLLLHMTRARVNGEAG